MILVYTKEKYPKFLFDCILTMEEINRIESEYKETLELNEDNDIKISKQGLFVDHQEYSYESTIVVERDSKFIHPISDDLETIREMTREEICENGDLSVLREGEKFADGHIIQVPNPSTQYLKYSWNRETYTWKLVTTKEELMLKRVDLIMEYNDLKNKITTLEELREFESTETIELLREKMNKIKEEADILLEKIKKAK